MCLVRCLALHFARLRAVDRVGTTVWCLSSFYTQCSVTNFERGLRLGACCFNVLLIALNVLVGDCALCPPPGRFAPPARKTAIRILDDPCMRDVAELLAVKRRRLPKGTDCGGKAKQEAKCRRPKHSASPSHFLPRSWCRQNNAALRKITQPISIPHNTTGYTTKRRNGRRAKRYINRPSHEPAGSGSGDDCWYTEFDHSKRQVNRVSKLSNQRPLLLQRTVGIAGDTASGHVKNHVLDFKHCFGTSARSASRQHRKPDFACITIIFLNNAVSNRKQGDGGCYTAHNKTNKQTSRYYRCGRREVYEPT